ncbi:hypothetical protein ABQE69_14890 [Mycolicibacillus trivialis]
MSTTPAAHADPPPPPGARVPAPEQVVAVLNQLTDPHIPGEVKSNLVEGGLSAEELGHLGATLNDLAFRADIPLNYTASDIVPAANDLAGVTVGATSILISVPVVVPMVLVYRDDAWRLTHDTYSPTFLDFLQTVKWRSKPNMYMPYIGA